MIGTPSYDLSPALGLLAFAAALALAPLAWVRWRHRPQGARPWLRALTLTTLFLTVDLVLFGAFTRLTDSGLGCPDWPGCYGTTSPLAAAEQIHRAQTALPSGPVTHAKAWVEMLHRYLAMAVGALIVALMVVHLWQRFARRRHAGVPLLWPLATFAWVCVQGAFGALTVTMKLYPSIVTAHLLGALVLLVLLALQSESYDPLPLRLSLPLRVGLYAVAALALLQIALGGWVSTNYAVLACADFPTCQGSFWPDMDFSRGFTLLRPLGASADGSWLPFNALTAIHYTHRLVAYVLLCALSVLAWRLHAAGDRPHRRWAGVLAAIAAWQLASGLSNVVLGWPLPAALAHTGGAAALAIALTMLLARSRPALQGVPLSHAASRSLDLAA
jgi:cytochrome c oxidase assembly protein subunit 15